MLSDYTHRAEKPAQVTLQWNRGEKHGRHGTGIHREANDDYQDAKGTREIESILNPARSECED